MPPAVFVDTSAFLAFFVPADANHEEACFLFEELRGARRPLFTSTDVVDEVVTFLRRRAGTAAAIEAGEALRDPGALRMLEVDPRLRDSAWRIFRENRSPGLSLTDCTSSAIMLDRTIAEVFTFDEDFRRLGHRTLPGPRPLLRPRPARPAPAGRS